MTDTHTHLYVEPFEDGGMPALHRAVDVGVRHFLLPGIDPETAPRLMDLAARALPLAGAEVRVALGLHPTELGDDWRARLSEMERLYAEAAAREPILRPVAIGEVGIDLHWRTDTLAEQKEAFDAQLQMSLDCDLPVIIHCRDARDETLEVISGVKERNNGRLPRLIFHSFTGSPEDVAAIRQVCDPWFGINGVVTFRNARGLHEAIPVIGLDHLLLETDSPWLAPVPHRGRPNESAYLPHVRDRVAALLNVTPAEVEVATDCNAASLFGFKL